MGGQQGRPREAPFASLSSEITRVVLDNGVRLLVREVYPSRVASLSVWVGVGSAAETAAQSGFSHFLEHLVLKARGTQGVGLAGEIQALGGQLNGFTSYETTCFWTAFPSRHLALALEHQASTLVDFRLSEELCARECQVLLEELNHRGQQPRTYCLEKLFELSYPDHPYGRSVAGRAEVFQNLDVGELDRFHKLHYVAPNVAVVAVGGVDTSEVVRLVKQHFSHLGGALPPRPPQLAVPRPGVRSLDLEGDLSSAYLDFAFPIPDLFSDEAFACDLLASILGRGRSSRLHQSVRERRELVTSIGASTFLGREPGLLLLRSLLPPQNLEAAEEAIVEVIQRLAREGVAPRELRKARNLVEAAYVFSQETVEGQGHKIGYYEMLGDYRLADDYVQRLWRVGEEQLLDAAHRFLAPELGLRVRYRPYG